MKAVEMETDYDGRTPPYGSGLHCFGHGITDEALGLDPDSRYIVTATKLPDGYRMVTEEEQAEWSKEDVANDVNLKYLDNVTKSYGGGNFSGDWHNDIIYVVPVDYTGPKKKLSATLTVKCGDEEVNLNQLPDELILELIKRNKGAN